MTKQEFQEAVDRCEMIERMFREWHQAYWKLQDDFYEENNPEIYKNQLNAFRAGYEISRKDNEKLRELLLELGAETHRNKKLYDWYCENK